MTGIICINKDKDITSFGVVSKVRGITKEKKAGHTGTLDPMATGVLPVLLGGATRFLDYLPESDKGYRAEFVLGKTTDTLDITGNVTGEYQVNAGAEQVKEALNSFKGTISQLPPMYSAVSVNGKRLYELARQGVEVERQARDVEIKKLELVESDDLTHTYAIDVLCSKGTYIRTLIDDIGRKLGCGAVMTSLVRTYAMGFSLKDCVTVGDLQKMKDSGTDFKKVLIPIEKMFDCYESVFVSQAQARRFSNGGALSADRIKKNLSEKIYKVYSPNQEFLGLGEYLKSSNELKVLRLLTRKD